MTEVLVVQANQGVQALTPAEARVRQLAYEFAGSWKRTLGLAVELGEALIELKAELEHGRWLPWVEQSFPLGEHMARNFMDFARNREFILGLSPDTTFAGARAQLQAQRRAERISPEPPEPGSIELELQTLLRFCPVDIDTATIVALILKVAFPDARTALDPTYGSGKFWDGSAHVQVTAQDLDPGRAPDGVVDFTRLPYAKGTYDVVVFDPPHLADSGDSSIMGEKFGTYPEHQLRGVITNGAIQAWRVARLGIICKVTDHVHAQRFQMESDWIRDGLGGLVPYDLVHQVRSGALIDPRWEERGAQLSAYNNGATFLIFRHDGPLHLRRG